ncbi:MAG: serine/threonine protein kinase, partial [Pseudomonadota bacterium]
MDNSTPSEETLFANALTYPTADRAAYLDQACTGNPALRSRVEALLQAHATARSLLQGSHGLAVRTALSVTTTAEEPGTMIGRYKLLEKIGEGSFGSVYMAEQEVPVRRRVALKVIK